MAAGTAPYNSSCMVFKSGADPIVYFDSLVDIAMSAGVTAMSDEGGAIYDSNKSIVSQAPTVNFTTKDIDKLITYTGIIGECGVVDVFFAQASKCDGRAADGNHLRFSMAQTLTVPNTLTAMANQDATLSATIHTLSDGTTAPVIKTGSQALPPNESGGLSVAPGDIAAVEQYTLGVANINVLGSNGSYYQVALDDIQGVTIDFGIEIKKRSGPGQIWPLWVHTRKASPVIRIQDIDVNRLGNATPGTGLIELLGNQAQHTGAAGYTQFQLRKKASGATFASGSVHLSFVCYGLCYLETIASASGSDEARTDIVIDCFRSATIAPIVFSRLQAYTTTPGPAA